MSGPQTLASILCLASLSVLVPESAAGQPLSPPERGDYDLLRAAKSRRFPPTSELANRVAPLAPTSLDSIDVLHLDLKLEIDPPTSSIAGAATLRLMPLLTPISAADLHLAGLTVDSVTVGGNPAVFNRTAGKLHVSLGFTAVPGDTLTVSVLYHGTPSDGLYFPAAWSVYNLSEPSFARNWFPSHDVPWDKMTSSLEITVPGGWEAIANGTHQSTTSVMGESRHRWSTAHPLPSYLISVNAADYDTVDMAYDGMPLQFFVRPADLAKAQVDFANLPAMLEAMESYFGPYPFSDEKYSVCEVANLGGAMENNTCTSYGNWLVTGDNFYDWVQAHELGHHWWGNLVSPAGWEEIWLNEGFATYSDALYHEYQYGKSSYEGRMQTYRTQYFNYDMTNRMPMYDPTPLFTATVYEKGAWVLHMIRSIMGDANFFQALLNYAAAHAHGNASTEDLRTELEALHGSDLTWFFDQWVYDQGYPYYLFDYEIANTGLQHVVWIRLEQIQVNAPVFTMPVDFRIHTVSGDTTVTLWNSTAIESYSLLFSDEPLLVEMDPEEKILKKSIAGSTPAGVPEAELVLEQNFPNPFNPLTSIRFGAGHSRRAHLDVFDVTGRFIVNLYRGSRPDVRRVYWNGRNSRGEEVSSGIYIYRLSTDEGTLSRKMLLLR